MRKYLITSITLLCLIFLHANLFAQEEKVIVWNPMTNSFINSPLINLVKTPDQEILADSVWQSIGPNNTDIGDFAFGDNNAEIIYAASRYNGVLKTINGGLNWIQTNNGISDPYIRSLAIHPQNSSIVLAGGFFEGLYRTTDAGLTWNAVTEVNDTTILAITFDHFHGDTVYVGTLSKGIYSSFDGGLTWQQTNYDSTTALDIIVDPQFTNIIYCSNSPENRVYKSTDYGNSWDVFFEGAPILAFAIDPHNSNIIYMGTLIGTSNLYKSTNGGQNWNYLPINGIIEDILIDDNNSGNVYLSVIGQGVFQSTDSALTWEPLNNGLTGLEVIKLKFHPLTTSTLYASTNHYGIFKIEDIVTGINESNQNIPGEFLLFQNYPNPFNPTTIINYSIPKRSFVTIIVYDLLGKEVETLVNEEKSLGNYEVEFNGSELSSGIYFYKMQAGSFSATKKLILIR